MDDEEKRVEDEDKDKDEDEDEDEEPMYCDGDGECEDGRRVGLPPYCSRCGKPVFLGHGMLAQDFMNYYR